MRFIPAGAGNTYGQSWQTCPLPVYPRWRGEHIRLVALSLIKVGLSPLARGTHYVKFSRNDQNRFIPAGAGNTFNHMYQVKEAAVYPRWRGEHISTRIWSRFSFGLSPLARGTPPAM